MSEEVQITIIGGGVVGCAVAYELSRDSGLDIVLVERILKKRALLRQSCA